MELRTVDPQSLVVNPDNPRRSPSSPDADQQMAASVQVVGILQPPIVKATTAGLEILYGERRVRGAVTVGLTEIIVLVVDASTGDQAMGALIENVVRAPLSPVDQWRAIDRLEAAGWNTVAIATTLALSERTIRQLRLLAQIHPPMLEHIAQGSMPGEQQLRLIARAPREEQAAVWKNHKPKKGQSVVWHEIARALHKQHMLAKHARFDAKTAQAFEIIWSENLFAPADEDSRYTTQVEAFLAAQEEWLRGNLPENGVILPLDAYGQPKLPPKAERLYGSKPGRGDRIGHYIDQQDGQIRTIPFRLPKPAAKPGKGAEPTAAAKPARPAVTKKGTALIGELRTEALHQALQEAEIDDVTLIGLLVLALGGDNVSVTTPVDPYPYGYRSETKRLATGLIEGGILTRDPASLRNRARAMLAAVLSCKIDASGSGMLARHAGVAIGADRWLASMANEEFLACLSKSALNAAAAASGVAPCNTGKATRAAFCRAFKDRHYVYPEARIELSPAELEAQQRWSGQEDEVLPETPEAGEEAEGRAGETGEPSGGEDSPEAEHLEPTAEAA